MLKHIFSIRFILDHISLFSNVENKIAKQDAAFKTNISETVKKLKETQKATKECRVFLENRLTPLNELDFAERMKPAAWTEIYKKMDLMQTQCNSVWRRLNDALEHIKLLAPQTKKKSINQNLYYDNDDIWMDAQSFPKMITQNISGRFDMMPKLYSRKKFGCVSILFILLVIFSAILAISLTFFAFPVTSFIASIFNTEQENILKVTNILRIISYIILALIVALFLGIIIWTVISSISIPNKKSESDKPVKLNAVRVMLFIIGISLVVTSVFSQNILSFILSLFGITEVSTIPQTAISIVALVLALFFIFGSLYNITTIRNIFISKNLEKKFEDFKDVTLEQLDNLTKTFEEYKSETIVLNANNIIEINHLKSYASEEIQAVNSKVTEKIHQIEKTQIETINQCKLDILLRLERMQYEIDGFQKKVDKIETYINDAVSYQK